MPMSLLNNTSFSILFCCELCKTWIPVWRKLCVTSFWRINGVNFDFRSYRQLFCVCFVFALTELTARLDYQPLFGKWAHARERQKSSQANGWIENLKKGLNNLYILFIFVLISRIQKDRVSEREKDLELLQEKLTERVGYPVCETRF